MWIFQSAGFRGSAINALADRQGISGQALIELAVFGSIFIMILAALVNYGLRYNFQQQIEMDAFRKALARAGQEGTAAYTVMADRHIPDAMDTFGIGASTLFAGSAFIARTRDQDDFEEEAVTEIVTKRENGVDIATTTVTMPKSSPWGWRYENNVNLNNDEWKLLKYRVIFNEVKVEDPDLNDPNNPVTLKIKDACIGNLIDYQDCYKQSVKIMSVYRCVDACILKHDQYEGQCSLICNQIMNPPSWENPDVYNDSDGGAWYAAYSYQEEGKYVFPVLDALFENAGAKVNAGVGVKLERIGFQNNSDMTNERDTSFQKVETAEDFIQTVDNVKWENKSKRAWVYYNNLDDYKKQISSASDDPYSYTEIGLFGYGGKDVVVSGDVNEKWITNK